MQINRAELRIGKKLGEGSQGSVYRVDNPHEDLPFRSLIYKEFAKGTKVSGAALDVLASLRDGLTDEQRGALDAFTVWPIATVVTTGHITGYLMQEIPPPFLQTIATSSGDDVIPREVQHLFVADAITQRNLGESPNQVERLALCREAAFALGFLHGRNVVFGDFSYKNAVYTLRPRPSIMLLDCDAVRVQGQGSAVAQLNSPGWTAPERSPQTKETDRYKLGLFILRCVSPETNAQTRDPEKARGMLDVAGLALLRRALSDSPSDRPSGKVWVEYFDAVIARSGGITRRRAPAPLPKGPAYRMARKGELKAPVVRRVPAPGGSVRGGQYRAPGPPSGGAGGFGTPRQPATSPAAARNSVARPASVLRKAPIYVTATGAPVGVPSSSSGASTGHPFTSPSAQTNLFAVRSIAGRPPPPVVGSAAKNVVVAPVVSGLTAKSLVVNRGGSSAGATGPLPQLSPTQSAALRAAVRQPGWKGGAEVWGVVVVLALVAVALAIGSTLSASRSSPAPATPNPNLGTRPPVSGTNSTTAPRPTLAAPPPGAALTEVTPCPPTDGSAVRTTTFAAPPPNCLVLGRNYSARVGTSAGSFTITLTDTGNRDAVNNFVVLSRYRYYEGTSFHAVTAQRILGGDANGDPVGTGTPGYLVPWSDPTTDRPRPRQVYLAPGFGGGVNSQLVIGVTGGASISGLVRIGEVTDGFDSAVQAIVAAGVGDPPARPITITAVLVSDSAVQR